MIKRCNDFGAGGVSVAVGELADGLQIDLGAVPKKYEGLDGTELAISESQERMAVVVESADADRFCRLASLENLEATPIAVVTEEPRLRMTWNGNTIVDLSREFLNSNGAEKHTDARVLEGRSVKREVPEDFRTAMTRLSGDLNVCSKRGLSERFDSTIGAGTVLMPFGGKYQQTPIQAMVQKISLPKGDTDTVSFMAWGYNPELTEASPFHGAYYAVIESVSKLIASGASFEDVYLTFQEYFEKPMRDPARWGKPLSALLGALRAQLDLGIGSIGGKDSMSGTFEKLDVPPTLVSFAVTTGEIGDVVSPEFKAPGHAVWRLSPTYDAKTRLVDTESLKREFALVTTLIRSGRALAVYTPGYGGEAEGILKMCLGNRIGFALDAKIPYPELFTHAYGGFILELADAEGIDCPEGVEAQRLGQTLETPEIRAASVPDGRPVTVSLQELQSVYEGKLEPVYPVHADTQKEEVPVFTFTGASNVKPSARVRRPRFLIPVFPGTNCEYDSAKAVERAGGEADIFVIRNLTGSAIAESVEAFSEHLKDAQAVFIPGGFSGGDEPDGSGKFITAFFRNQRIFEGVQDLLSNRDGLMCGICNGFQALIKLGLVPYGEIRTIGPEDPTLTFNTIARHQSMLVRTRVCSHKSPWLMYTEPGEIYTVPISHGEGRFMASKACIDALAKNGQVATQYVDLAGNPTMDIDGNPNGSLCAIEGILSPDGRVIGKMGHSERVGTGLYRNVPGLYDMPLFKGAVDYFA